MLYTMYMIMPLIHVSQHSHLCSGLNNMYKLVIWILLSYIQHNTLIHRYCCNCKRNVTIKYKIHNTIPKRPFTILATLSIHCCPSFTILTTSFVTNTWPSGKEWHHKDEFIMHKSAAPWQNQHYGFATSMDPDQPAHPRSLIRIHAVCYQFLYL
jgi:hypothetical protein